MIDLILRKPNNDQVSGKPMVASNWIYSATIVVAFLVAMVVFSPSSYAQNPQQPATEANAKQDDRPIPPPANITLETKDKVLLKCTYFAAPTDQAGSGKSVIPFLLIHDWDGSRADLLPFAEYLQKSGYAVIVPDLRGHGESIARAGGTAKLDSAKLRKSDMTAVLLDIERCKKYLVQRNNDGELNIDLLNVVVVGKSAVFALDWTISDWSWQNRGAIKQGKDVKSLTLISPEKKAKNIGLSQSLRSPLFSGRAGNNLPTLVLWSADDDVAADESDSIYRSMKKGRPDLDKIEDPEKRREQESLFKVAIPSSRYTGTELIRDDGRLWKYIANFVETKVGSKKDDYRWQSRERD
jgi:hypothetical protein